MKRLGRILLTVLIVLVVVVGATIGFLAIRQTQVRGQVEREWQATQVSPILDLGSTQTLEIIPLVDELAAGEGFQIEHGVSYLIRTDAATILFDVGQNTAATDPSPLQANMQKMGIDRSEVQMIVISHNHPDHTGGVAWWRAGSFSLGNQQVDLGNMPAYVPTAMNYPGLAPTIANEPQRIATGVATLGTIGFAEVWQLALFQARTVEQALAVHVAGRGIVMISGCGHQTLPKLLARADALFDEPVVGLVGGLHYENGDSQAVQPDIERLLALQPQLLALSPHDSEAVARQAFGAAFPDLYRDVMVGEPIRLAAPVAHAGRATK